MMLYSETSYGGIRCGFEGNNLLLVSALCARWSFRVIALQYYPHTWRCKFCFLVNLYLLRLDLSIMRLVPFWLPLSLEEHLEK